MSYGRRAPPDQPRIRHRAPRARPTPTASAPRAARRRPPRRSSRPVGALGRRPLADQAGRVDPAAGVEQAGAVRGRPAGLGPQRPAAVGVAEDHVVGLDPEALGDLAHRGEPGLGDRARGQVRLDRAQPEPVGDPHGARQGDRAEQPAAEPSAHVSRPRSALTTAGPTGPGPGLARRLPGRARRGRRRRATGRARTRRGRPARAGPPADRWRRRAAAERALDRGEGHPLEGRDRQVPVEVVAVGRVDVVAHPDARIGDLGASPSGRRSPAAERSPPAGARSDQAERLRPVEPPRREPVVEQRGGRGCPGTISTSRVARRLGQRLEERRRQRPAPRRAGGRAARRRRRAGSRGRRPRPPPSADRGSARSAAGRCRRRRRGGGRRRSGFCIGRAILAAVAPG